MRPSDELLEQMFATIHLAIAVLNPDFSFVRVNRAYALAGKHDPEWFVGRNHFDLYPNAENEALFTRVLETGEAFTAFAKPFAYPDQPERGTTYWDWTLQPVHNESGTITSLILSLVEVTARERAREAAEREHRRLYSILNKLPGFISINSPTDHTLRFLNEASQALFGDPAGRPCYEVLGGRKEPCGTCESLLVLQSGKPRDWEWSTPTGQVYHVWGFPFSEPGERDLVLQFGVDITKRRQMEKEILSIAAAERQRVGEDLHESLGQTLTGASMLSKALTERLTAAGSCECLAAADVSSLLLRAVRRVRALARGLCSVELGRWGLQDALSRLADETARGFGVSCLFHSSDEIVIEQSVVAAQLYKVAQAAVSHALTHASPGSIVILLKSTCAGPMLTIEHDGTRSYADEEDGVGLRIMKHCASQMGASLDVQHRPEGGTVITCAMQDRPTGTAD